MNGTQYNMLASPAGDPNTTITLTGALAHVMRNNIGYPNKNANMTGVDTMFNTWDLNITPAATDFLSISDPSVTGTGVAIESSGALGPRAADGSMPAVDFLKLAAASRMIDKGTNVGLPFVGAAPDLGAYEFGAPTSTAAGGNSGTSGGGGSTGAGGITGGAGGTLGTGGSTGTAGSSGGTGGTSGGTGGAVAGTGGASSAGGSGAGDGAGGASGGCSCAVDGVSERGAVGLWAALSVLAWVLLRKRRARPGRIG
jgi:MYXO-CTERM domain-containing protein